MQKRGIIVFLIILAAVIVAVIVIDYISGKPDRSKPNPFAYDVEEFKKVDPSLINYRESKNFKIGFDSPAAITVNNDMIYLAGDKKLKIINTDGTLLEEFSLPAEVSTIEVADEKIFMAVNNRIFTFDISGQNFREWTPLEEGSFITSIAAAPDDIFFADAGKRRILRYNAEEEYIGEFDGKAESGELNGFIVPSPCFDMDINDDGELWIVNPGLHALENYTYSGNLRTYWKRTSMKPEGFSGCCNPAYFCFLSDGRYVTSEKGLVRIKTYKRSGELEGVVAAPDKFVDEGHAPAVAVDSRDNIYALDFDRKIVRVFTPLTE